jgi:hypothetical protein
MRASPKKRRNTMRSILKVLSIVLVAGSTQRAAHATEPCMPSPCSGANYAIDVAKCRSLADWVATGTITRVVHHRQGEPVFKDFADFTFTVKASEKGTMKPGREIAFQVGWCQNWLQLPKETSGTFRFYGLPLPADAGVPNQYLYFERVARPSG